MSNETPIRVMVVDDHAVVRSGLSKFLLVYPDLELVGEADSGEEAVQRCQLLRPDVVLMDLKMPGMDGVTATRLIRQSYPATQVVVLTSFHDEAMVQGALQAGAIGFLLKDVTAAELAQAVRSARAGRMTLASEATQALINAAIQPPPPGDDLTSREREVLALMVEGLSNNQIADRLVLSVSTVKFHVSSILSKLGVESRVAAVTLAIQRHLVT